MPQSMAADTGKKRDGESGRYVESVSDVEILDFVGAHDLVGTTDVSDRFGHSQPTAYRRLRSLEEDGEIRSRSIGNARIWQINDSEDEV